jgi:hypothetical protein
VTFTATDATSSLKGDPEVVVIVDQEGVGQVASHTFTDQAGLTTVAQLGGINIDRTPPNVGFLFANLPNIASPEEVENELARWHNEDVVFDVVSTDFLSGVASVSTSQIILAEEGVAVSGSVTVTDFAGNSVTVFSPLVKIDKTAPTLVFGPQSPPANVAGWNNSDVAFSFTTADNLSGVGSMSPPSPLILSGEGVITGEVAVSDMAGNNAIFTSPPVQIDRTPPSLTCVAEPSLLWPPNSKMIPVAVSMAFSDEQSGASSFTVTTAASSEPDSGLSKGDQANDFQGFELGNSTLAGALRAERAGDGPGRQYTLGYTGVDLAGNSANCLTTVNVPHDQGKGAGKNKD